MWLEGSGTRASASISTTRSGIESFDMQTVDILCYESWDERGVLERCESIMCWVWECVTDGWVTKE